MSIKKKDFECTNIFKNHKEKEIQTEFTRKWIELINNYEKAKDLILAR